MERTKSNRVLLEKRRSMKKMGILDDGSDGEASITPKLVSLGVLKLLGSGSSGNERSVFSRIVFSRDSIKDLNQRFYKKRKQIASRYLV
jgi:hypothetical protein